MEFELSFLSSIFCLTEISQTAAEDLHAIGPFDVLGEFVFVFTRIWNTFVLARSLDIEGLDLRANKMWAGV
jgi:hypothetical protein